MSPTSSRPRFVAEPGVGASMMPSGVPTGPLRAPGSNALAFVVPVASSTSWRMPPGNDPLQFRLDLLGEPRIARPTDDRTGRSPISTPAACAACSSSCARSPAGAAAQLPKGDGHGRRRSTTATWATSPRWSRRRSQRTATSRSRRSGSPPTWAARSSTRPAPMNQVQGAVLDGIGQALHQRDHHRERPRGADELPRLPAAAHQPGAAGRSAFP